MPREIFTARGKVRRVVVVGGGIAGLSCAICLCERGVPVLLLTNAPARRSNAVCNPDGIFAGTRGGGDEPAALAQHVQDTLIAGHHRAHLAPLVAMVNAAPGIVRVLSRLGVPFDRTEEGHLRLRGAAGTTGQGTAYAGTATGQHTLYALEEQLRRYAALELQDAFGGLVPGEPRLRLLEGWEFQSLVLDDNGVAVGVVAQDVYTMAVKALPADAVCLATGGYASLFGNSTASSTCLGSATASVFEQGAVLADPELFSSSPLAAWAPGKARRLTELLLLEGGRIWTPRVETDTRAPERIPPEERRYVLDGKLAEDTSVCYLDVSNIPRPRRTQLLQRLPASLRAESVNNAHVRLTASVEYSLGGLWVDQEVDATGSLVLDSARSHSTSISGAFAAGEACAQYHGAGLLGCNRILSHVFGGQCAARGMDVYVQSLARSALDLPGSLFDRAEQREVSRYEAVLKGSDKGTENVGELEEALAQTMTLRCSGNVTVENATRAGQTLEDLVLRSAQVQLTDRGSRLNQCIPNVLRLRRTLTLAQVITHCLARRHDAQPGARRTLVRRTSNGTQEFLQAFEYESLGSPVKITNTIERSSLPGTPASAAPSAPARPSVEGGT